MKRFDVPVAIVVHDGLVLICRRLADAPLGGMWEFPGGKREPEETLEACLHREMKEELDIKVQVIEHLVAIEHQYPQMKVTLYPMLCHWIGGEPRAISSQQFIWAEPEKLHEFQFPEANQSLIEWVVEHLKPGEESGREDELDALHIRQVSRARQAAMRASSYCLIGAVAGMGGGLDLAWRAIGLWKAQTQWAWPAIYIAVAALFISLAGYLWGKARKLAREARQPALAEPDMPPDFSRLSDGSQIVRNLERM